MLPERWLYVVPLRLRSLFHRRRIERELDEELRFHLECQIEEYVAQGLTPDEARFAALRAFGGVERRKDECRDARRVSLFDETVQDVHYAIRVLRKGPGFTAAVLLILALGIGANSAMFSLVHAVLLRALPYPDDDRIVRMLEESKNGPMSISWPDYLDWHAKARSFENMGAIRREEFTVNGLKEPMRVKGQRATAEIFQLAGARMAAGRAFTIESDKPGAPLEAVLSHEFSRENFMDESRVVGRVIEIDGEPCTIVGILDASSRLFMDADIVASFGWIARLSSEQYRGNHFGTVAIGKLKREVSARSAHAEMQQIARELELSFPDTNSEVRVEMKSLHESLMGNVRPMVLTLAAAVGLLLLIACANVANLFLARISVRRRELALRVSLGASRFRIVRQLITESVVVALAGGVLGLMAGSWTVELIRRLAPPGIPRLDTARVDWTVVAATFAVALLTGILFGLAPAWGGFRTKLSDNLQRGGRAVSSGSGRLGGALTIAEVALSVLLLVGAGLLIRSFILLLHVNPGFNPKNVLALRINLPPARYSEHRARGFYRQVLERIRRLPGVRSAGVARSLPVLGSTWTSIYGIRDQPAPALANRPLSSFNPVSIDYFRTMQIRLLEGRVFTSQDKQHAPLVVAVTRTFARRNWPNGRAIGRQMRQGGDGPWRTVVGIVQDLKQGGLDTDFGAEVFLPIEQEPTLLAGIVVRSHDISSALADAVRHEIHAVDPLLPVRDMALMEDWVGATLVRRQGVMVLLSLFACLALLLAGGGVYGVVAYSVAQRTREIGIRKTLGALRIDIVLQVLWRGLRLSLAGVGIGLLLAPALTRIISTELFGVSSLDPITFSAGAVAVLVVSLAACWIPASRASAVDPILAVQAE